MRLLLSCWPDIVRVRLTCLRVHEPLFIQSCFFRVTPILQTCNSPFCSERGRPRQQSAASGRGCPRSRGELNSLRELGTSHRTAYYQCDNPQRLPKIEHPNARPHVPNSEPTDIGTATANMDSIGYCGWSLKLMPLRSACKSVQARTFHKQL